MSIKSSEKPVPGAVLLVPRPDVHKQEIETYLFAAGIQKFTWYRQKLIVAKVPRGDEEKWVARFLAENEFFTRIALSPYAA